MFDPNFRRGVGILRESRHNEFGNDLHVYRSRNFIKNIIGEQAFQQGMNRLLKLFGTSIAGSKP